MKSQKWIIPQNVEIVKNFYTYKRKEDRSRALKGIVELNIHICKLYSIAQDWSRHAIDHVKLRYQCVHNNKNNDDDNNSRVYLGLLEYVRTVK